MKNIFDSWTKSTKIALTSIVLVMMAAFAGFTTFNVSANATAPQKLQMAIDGRRVAYIGDTTFTIKKVTSGAYAYCIEYPKLSPSGATMILEGEKDSGYAYFLENGYPTKKITGDEGLDYYITQTAIWWYIDDTTGTRNISDAFKTTAADPHNLRPHIKRLVEGAKAARSKGYIAPAINVSVPGYTFSYSGSKATYYSSAITVSGTKISGSYTVSVAGLAGAYVTDVNGNAKSAFLPGQSFKVAVPYGKALELNNKITVTVRATGKLVKAYSYRPEYNADLQKVLPFIGITHTYNLVRSVDLTLSTSKLTVYKKDSVSKAMLPGAKLALYDMNNVMLKTWITSSNSLTILGLVPGKYYIKELETPSGYNMITAVVNLSLNPAEHKHLTIYNIKQKPTQITIVKRDKQTGAVLPGAKLVLKTEKGEVVSTWTSTDKGRRFTGLPEGKYTITELAAPNGYKLLTKVYTVELVAGKALMIDLYNEKVPEVVKPPVIVPEEKITKLRVWKYDASTGNLLANAKLQIKDASGKVVKEWITTNKEYYVEGLAAGKYTLIEVSAPNGYVLYTDAIAFELVANNTIQDVKMYNTPLTIVPITDASASKLTLIIGAAVMAAGGYVVYMNTRKRHA